MNSQRMSESDVARLARLTGVSIDEIRKGLAMGLHPVLTPRSTSGGGAEAREQEEKPA